jgi:hypothetical protein
MRESFAALRVTVRGNAACLKRYERQVLAEADIQIQVAISSHLL